MKAELFAVTHLAKKDAYETDYFLVARNGMAFLITLSTRQGRDNTLKKGQVVQAIMYDHMESITEIRTKRYYATQGGRVFHEASRRVGDFGIPTLLARQTRRLLHHNITQVLTNSFNEYDALSETMRFLPLSEAESQ